MVISKIELTEITLHMRLGAVLEHALHATLENGGATLNRISVNIAAHIFTDPMLHIVVRSELGNQWSPSQRVLGSFIRHDVGQIDHS